MSSDKTKRLGLNKWVGSDQVLRAEFNENFDRIDAYVDDSLAVKTTSVQLKQGLQVIDVNQSSPLNNVTIQGRTLVNLLGRDGNCEDLTKWGTFQVSQALDSNNKSIGNNAIKLTLSTGFTSGSISTITTRTFSFKAGKYYVAIADIKNGTATNGNFYINGTTAAKGQHIITATDKFYPAWRAYNPDADVSGLSMVLGINGAVGQYAYFDGVRIYEITQAEYNALDRMTPEQIAAKWPYVDDMKSVYSPYIIKYGENLLPPFTEWNYVSPAGVFKEPYTLSIIGGTNPISYNAWVIVPVLRNTSYTLSAQHNGRIAVYTQSIQPIAEYTTSGSLTFNSGDNDVVHVYFSANGSNGVFSFINPMLNLGPGVLQFKPRNDDHLFFPNLQLASNVDGTVYDSLYQRDGKYWKQMKLKTMDLDGGLNWLGVSNNYTGYRRVYLSISPNVIYSSQKVIKFDGKILGPIGAIDGAQLNSDGNLFLDIAAIDSGWGDSYTDLSIDEIKAYFYGWQMLNPNGDPWIGGDQAQKRWFAKWSPGAVWDPNGNAFTRRDVPKELASGYIPYKLQYQLATPIVEEITFEGGITLHEGSNQITVGTGAIVRENIRWVDGEVFGYGIYYFSNHQTMAGGATKFRKRIKGTAAVYKNGCRDFSVSSAGTGIDDWIKLDKIAFDPAAAYTVTYLALDQYALSCNAQSIQFERAANMKSVVDTLAAGQSDMAARVGALEITRAQRAQPQWIEPTLLNGWVNYGQIWHNAGYSKSGLNEVEFIGAVKNTTRTSSIFILPKDFRPSKLLSFVVSSHTGTSDITGRIDVYPDGRIDFVSGNTFFVSLNGVRFLAEQ